MRFFLLLLLLVGCTHTPVARRLTSDDGCPEYGKIASPGEVRLLSQRMAARWSVTLGKDPQEFPAPERPDGKTQLIRVKGIPRNARWVTAPENLVFRHYTDNAETVAQIRKSGGLANAFVSYEEVSPTLYRKTFEDVSGIFLTLPDVKAGLVGREGMSAYVDVRVPPGTPVLEVEAGRIYVIPLPAQTRPWVAKVYKTYLAKGELAHDYQEMCEAIERRGGIAGELVHPVTIVGQSAASK